MASGTPARALGLERELGELRPGLAADLLVLRGKELEIEQVFVRGKALI
jgi:N-acetylglucosamine-6-phosphate deacetylase